MGTSIKKGAGRMRCGASIAISSFDLQKKRHFLGVTFSKNCRVQLHGGSAECLLNAGVCTKFLALKYFKWIRPHRNQYQLTTFDLFNGAIKGAASLCNRAEIQHSRTETHTHTHQKKKKKHSVLVLLMASYNF